MPPVTGAESGAIACAGRLAAKPAGQQRRRGGGQRAEPGQQHRMPRQAGQRGAQHVGREPLPLPEERSHQPLIGAAVPAQRGGGFPGRASQHRRRPVRERVGQGDRRLHPVQPETIQREPAEHRRANPERVHRRADVVGEPRDRELGGARAAAYLGGGLEDAHCEPRPGQRDGCGEPVWPGTDNHRIEAGHPSSMAAGKPAGPR
jgi:hypothetical protein